LEIYEQTGQIRSNHLRLQHSAGGPSAVSGQLRFSEICMIWVQCNQQGVNNSLKICYLMSSRIYRTCCL